MHEALVLLCLGKYWNKFNDFWLCNTKLCLQTSTKTGGCYNTKFVIKWKESYKSWILSKGHKFSSTFPKGNKIQQLNGTNFEKVYNKREWIIVFYLSTVTLQQMMAMFNILQQNILPTFNPIQTDTELRAFEVWSIWTERKWFHSFGSFYPFKFLVVATVFSPFFCSSFHSVFSIKMLPLWKFVDNLVTEEKPKTILSQWKHENILGISFCHVDDDECHENNFHCLLFFAQIVLTS